MAQKYESSEFLKKDPSQFMHRYSSLADVETVAFLAANLAFGRRDQILSHVEAILENCGSSPSQWVLSSSYKKFFPQNEKSFYRMYTNRDMIKFFDSIRLILENSASLGDFFKSKWQEVKNPYHLKDFNSGNTKKSSIKNFTFLHQVIASAFPKSVALLPHSPDSAAKKVNMLLRWLVRDNSPVDLGLWTWYSKEDLLMPLDTHVMQQSLSLGLINSKSANLKTALELSCKVSLIFPGDPVKADFALFGMDFDSL